MEAGRELDALVAEKVMGWELRSQGYLGARTIEYWWPGIGGMEMLSVEHWSPSLYMDAAWKVVEKFNDVEIEKSGLNYSVIIIQGGPVRQISESAPHAICLAALRAVGVEV